MNNREEFERWCGDTSWTPYQKSIMFLAWQQQQKKIDELKADNERLKQQIKSFQDSEQKLLDILVGVV